MADVKRDRKKRYGGLDRETIIAFIVALAVALPSLYFAYKIGERHSRMSQMATATSTVETSYIALNEETADATDTPKGQEQKTASPVLVGRGLIGFANTTAYFRLYRDAEGDNTPYVVLCSPERFLDVSIPLKFKGQDTATEDKEFSYSINLGFWDKRDKPPYCVRFYPQAPVLTATAGKPFELPKKIEKMPLGYFVYAGGGLDIKGEFKDNGDYLMTIYYTGYTPEKTAMQVKTLDNASVSLTIQPEVLERLGVVNFAKLPVAPPPELLSKPLHFAKNDRYIVIYSGGIGQSILGMMPVIPTELKDLGDKLVSVSQYLGSDVPIYISQDAIVITATAGLPAPRLVQKSFEVSLPAYGYAEVFGSRVEVFSDEKGVEVRIPADFIGGFLKELSKGVNVPNAPPEK